MTAPAPLTPPECTMSGNDWFPFYFDRVRKSKWWRRASDTARARNVMMWGEAFKGVPAGSLPDDDDDLAEAAGYGMNVDAFLAVKDEIMGAWVLCSDGRWYHPTVCEVVLEVWDRASERRKAAAQRQQKRRQRIRGQGQSEPEVTPQTQPVTPDPQNVTRDIAESERDFGIHTGHTGHTGQTDKDANASIVVQPKSKPKRRTYPDDFESAWKAYPHHEGRSSKPESFAQWRALPQEERDGLPAAIERFRPKVAEVCGGKGAPCMSRWLKAGKHLNWAVARSPAGELPLLPATASWTGPQDVWDAVAEAKTPEWATAYLTPCRWRDVPQRSIVSDNGFRLDKLRQEVGHVLRARGIALVKDQAA